MTFSQKFMTLYTYPLNPISIIMLIIINLGGKIAVTKLGFKTQQNSPRDFLQNPGKDEDIK
jgi:hypothetical protein